MVFSRGTTRTLKKPFPVTGSVQGTSSAAGAGVGSSKPDSALVTPKALSDLLKTMSENKSSKLGGICKKTREEQLKETNTCCSL